MFVLVLILIFIFALYLGVHICLNIALVHTLNSWSLCGKISVSVVFWILALSFFIMQWILRKNISPQIGHYMYWISTSWIVFILYTAIIYGLVLLLNACGIHIPHGIFISMGLAILVMCWGFVQFSQPKIQHKNIVISKNFTEKQQIKTVFISDVHLGYGITRNRLHKFVETINHLQPDIVLIGGDLIDMNIYPVEADKMYEELNGLTTKYGIFMVLGNHDYLSGKEKTLDFINKTNITLLQDSIATLPNGMQIIGRDDKTNISRQSVEYLTQTLNPQQASICIDHQPDNETIDSIVSQNIDLALFGHTHNGQFFPINLITALRYKHSYGYDKINNTHIYTSSGLGLWGPPFRIGSQSEIVVLDIALQ